LSVSSTWSQNVTDSPNPRLFVGGLFDRLRSPPATDTNGVAIWDDRNAVWSAIPIGLNLRTEYANSSIASPHVNDEILSAYWDDINQALYIGGSFSEIGGVLSPNIVKLVNQTTWLSLSTSCDGDVLSIVRAGNLGIVVGGNFTQLNLIKSGGLALLNDIGEWQSLGFIDGSVQAMVVYNNQLFVGGDFTNVAGIFTNGFAVYDLNNKTWVSYGQVCGGGVTELAVLDNLLYLAGTFTSYTSTKLCPGVQGEKLAEFNLTSYTFTKSLRLNNETINGDVTALVAQSGILVVCGYFTSVGTLSSVDRFAVYTPYQGWSSFGGKNFGIPFYGHPPIVAVGANGNIYFGGYFLGYFGVACYRLGTSIWSNLGNGVSCTFCPDAEAVVGYQSVPTVTALAIMPYGTLIPKAPEIQHSSDLLGNKGIWEEYQIPSYPGSSELYQNSTDYQESVVSDSRPKVFYWQTWSVVGAAIFVGSLLLATLLNICFKAVRHY